MSAKSRRILLALVVAALAAWGLYRLSRDDFDYAAAFEDAPAGGAAPVVDLKAVAGKSPEEVKQILGEPQRCEMAQHSQRCSYQPGALEIVYIGGKADWMTVRRLGEAGVFGPETLPLLGLPAAEPVEADEQRLQWRDLAGLREVMLVGDENGVRYVRVKAVTP